MQDQVSGGTSLRIQPHLQALQSTMTSDKRLPDRVPGLQLYIRARVSRWLILVHKRRTACQ
jgi:hypothetical protein